jgi:hypothetical protein
MAAERAHEPQPPQKRRSAKKENQMRTDHPIYLFLSEGAEAFRVLTGGLQLAGAYRFTALTIKGIERRLDGLLEPEGHAGPVYVVEFQGQRVETAWYNLITKIGLYGEAHPEREVLGVGIFLHEDLAPASPSWLGAEASPVRAVYLNRFLPAWLAREPDNPYVAVCAPLFLEDAELRAQAARLWRCVQDAPLSDAIRVRSWTCWNSGYSSASRRFQQRRSWRC